MKQILVIAFVVLLLTAPGWSQITLQSTCGKQLTDYNVYNVTSTPCNVPAAGNTIIVVCRQAIDNTLPTVRDTLGNTYTHIAGADSGLSSTDLMSFWRTVSKGGYANNQATCQWNTLHDDVSVLQRVYSGIATSNPVDTTASAINTTAITTATSPSFSATQANELVLACASISGPYQGFSVGLIDGLSATNLAADYVPNVQMTACEDLVLSSPQSNITASMHLAFKAEWEISVATFKPPPISNGTLTSISVSPVNPSVVIDQTQQFQATGTLGDGSTVDLTRQVSWSSDRSPAVWVNSTGLAVGNAECSATITAELNGISGTTTLTVTPAPATASLVSLAVTPANPSIAMGSTQQFQATGTFSDNSTAGLTSQVSWSSGSPAIATITTGGLATGVMAGSSLITATLNAISGAATLTVTNPPPPPPSSPNTLFNSSAVPAVPNASAGVSIELGMKFTADRNGTITALRFYKGAGNSGPHVENLWSSTGQLLATATFTNETDSGWQQVNLATPVAITANTTYVVSYHTPASYSVSFGYFNAAVDNAPLHAPASGASNGNGVYAYGRSSVFPSGNGFGANYWVDVVFTPAGTSTASLKSLAVTPAKPSITMGSTQQFQAMGTFSDNSTADLTSQVSWASGSPSVATITSGGLATGATAGSSLITAALNGISNTATLTVTSPPPPPSSSGYSLFSSPAVPAVPNASAGVSIELGMQFTADRNGTITALRFYKGAGNSGPHVGNLWSSTGQLLATATFTNETDSGWQQVNLATPVAITANVVYVVSYHTPKSYSVDFGYFNLPVDNSPLHAVLNRPSSGNGVYAYGRMSTFPTASGNGANFWVDVVFQ